MKKLLILIIVLAAIYAAVKLSIKSPDQSIPSATEEPAVQNDNSTTTGDQQSSGEMPTRLVAAEDISVAFTGYGPGGKTENGAVKAKESSLARTGSIFAGSVTFDMSTVTSTPIKDKLITHLKGSDFFDVAKYPIATFAITSATNTQIKGNLTMKGITKAITLPVSYDSASGTYTSTVRVNMEDFGIKQTFTDKEFVLNISVK